MGDEEFLQKLSEDGWTATYNPNPHDWVPQGELYVTSGKPLDLRKEDND